MREVPYPIEGCGDLEHFDKYEKQYMNKMAVGERGISEDTKKQVYLIVQSILTDRHKAEAIYDIIEKERQVAVETYKQQMKAECWGWYGIKMPEGSTDETTVKSEEA